MQNYLSQGSAMINLVCPAVSDKDQHWTQSWKSGMEGYSRIRKKRILKGSKLLIVWTECTY